ncbi:hypothetical protein J3R30DRAFT_3500665 [Lentinula aciculospora]|uniref:RING-type domain-containing protein n=1 Tax=Lentinula aciculospora TaxID=153920 RepID=A0A9W9A7L2_9AGAR|nr:hypothetical protein J3R30DRAFT_3500665 [Lentinula aciculospora]
MHARDCVYNIYLFRSIIMAKLLCEICYQARSLDNFLFSTCGHGFCTSCTTSLDKSRTCPSCRKPRKKADVHKLYFTLPEQDVIDVHSEAQSLIHSMTNIHTESTLSLTDKVTNGLKEAAKKSKMDADTASKLLEVAKNMEDNLRPIFFRLQLERDEKRALQEKVNLWQPRVIQVEALKAEVARSKQELESVIRANQRTIAKNNQLASQLEADRVEIEKLRKDVIDERRLYKERDELVQQLKRDLEYSRKQAVFLNKKLKVLAQSSSSNRISAGNTADDTLIVKPAVLGPSMKWETLVKAMVKQGFTVEHNHSGPSVRFDPPDPTKRSITFQKPHPDTTINPILLKEFNKKFRKYCGRDLFDSVECREVLSGVHL